MWLWLEPGGDRSERPSISGRGGSKASKEKAERSGVQRGKRQRQEEKTRSVIGLKSVLNTKKKTQEENVDRK